MPSRPNARLGRRWISTTSAVIKALGLRRLRNLDPIPPVQRYQGEKPGDMIHVDTRKLARFEQKATTVGFVAPALGLSSQQGITCRRLLSDNGSADRSGEWRKAFGALDLKPIRTGHFMPRTNGKAERFIQTLCRGRAYGMAFQTSETAEPLAAPLSRARYRPQVPHGSRWSQPTAVSPAAAER